MTRNRESIGALWSFGFETFDFNCLAKETTQMKKTILSVTAAALILGIGLSRAVHARAAASGQDDASDKYQVKIDNFSFTPPTLTVPAGATVTWVNQDDVPHNVVSSEGKTLKSRVMDTDEKFSYTFTQAGTYPYYCGIHPKMIGKIIVQ
jgi:amicyanin